MSDERFAMDHRIWRDVAKVAIIGLAAGVAFLVIGRLVGARPSVGLSLGLPTAAGALLQMLMLTLTENLPVQAEQPEPFESASGPVVRLRQLERRLQGASTDGSKFDWNVRPVLLELAADKLRYKYAVNLRAQPEQARTILGEQLWLDLNSPQNAPSSAQSLARLRAMVAAIEAI
jgi:hypothetical protein